MRRTILIASLLLAAACKPSTPGPRAPASGNGASAAAATPSVEPTPPPSTTSEAELDQLMREIVAYVAALGDAAAATGGDCATMAVALERVIGEHGDLAARAARLDGDPTAEDRGEAWMKANDATARPVLMKLAGEVERCKDAPAVQAAMARIGAV